MSDRLVDFVVDLVNDRKKLAAFEVNPQEQVEAAGLTEDERAAVLSREGQRILTAIGASGLSLGEVSMKPPPAAPRPPAKPRPPVKPPVKPPRKKAPARKRTPSRPLRKKR